MNEFEAQLKITEVIKQTLIGLYEGLSPEGEDMMGDAADIIVEALGLEVQSVAGAVASLTVDLSDPA
jgi:hypothetical protein